MKRKVAATTEAEATNEALRCSAALDHLQVVCLKDSRSHPASLKEYVKAAETWLWVLDVDLNDLHAARGKHSKEALENKEALQVLSDEVIEHFRPSDKEARTRET